MEDPGEVQGHLALADGRRGDGVPFMIYVKYFFLGDELWWTDEDPQIPDIFWCAQRGPKALKRGFQSF